MYFLLAGRRWPCMNLAWSWIWVLAFLEQDFREPAKITKLTNPLYLDDLYRNKCCSYKNSSIHLSDQVGKWKKFSGWVKMFSSLLSVCSDDSGRERWIILDYIEGIQRKNLSSGSWQECQKDILLKMEKGTGSKWRRYLTRTNGCSRGRKIKTNYPVGSTNSGCDRERICVVDVVPSNYHSFIHSTKQKSSKNNIYDFKKLYMSIQSRGW